MSTPKPPFHSTIEELLYNIYLKLPDVTYLTANDINSITKLNALIQDADLLSSTGVTNAIGDIKGNVPVGGDTLEKLYNIIQGLTYLSKNEIDTLAELNAVLTDADLVRTEDLSNAIASLRGNVPTAGNTLEKLYGIIQGLNFLSQEQIDTLAELNAVLTDADLVREEDLDDLLNTVMINVGNMIQGLALNRRSVQYFFAADQEDQHNRDRYVFRGTISSLTESFTNELSGVTYRTRLDTSSSWVDHAGLASIQTWIDANITGNELTGTKYWIKCVPIYKLGHDDEAVNVFFYRVL